MNWTHKNINIEINTKGEFVFKYCDRDYIADSLSEAKEIIDDLTEAFYNIDESFFRNMQKKLSDKEKLFLKELIKELRCHDFNAYCELGIHNYLNFQIDEKVFEICKNEDNI